MANVTVLLTLEEGIIESVQVIDRHLTEKDVISMAKTQAVRLRYERWDVEPDLKGWLVRFVDSGRPAKYSYKVFLRATQPAGDGLGR